MSDPVPPGELGLSLPDAKDVKLNPETPATVKVVKKILDLLQTCQESFRQTDESIDNRRLRLFTNCVQPDGDRWRLSVIRSLDEQLVDIRINRLKPDEMTEDEWYKRDLKRPDNITDSEWQKLRDYYRRQSSDHLGYRVYLLWGDAGQEYKRSTAFQFGALQGNSSYVVQGQEGELIISDNTAPGDTTTYGGTKKISADKVLGLLTNGRLMLPQTEKDRPDRI